MKNSQNKIQNNLKRRYKAIQPLVDKLEPHSVIVKDGYVSMHVRFSYDRIVDLIECKFVPNRAEEIMGIDCIQFRRGIYVVYVFNFDLQ